jgi:SOS response regulatory protein OraA/RecX
MHGFDDDTGTQVEAARTAAIRLLARRELSAAQVKERLLRRGHPEHAADEAIVRLQDSGLIDDARVARAFARTRTTVKRFGRERIVRELHGMGIDRETAGSGTAQHSTIPPCSGVSTPLSCGRASPLPQWDTPSARGFGGGATETEAKTEN